MKKELLLILASASLAFAQTANVTKTITNDRLTGNLRVPSGKTLTIESGGTINATGATITGFTATAAFADITGAAGDNASLAAALALKAPLASPTFTGSPTINSLSAFVAPNLTFSGQLLGGGASGTLLLSVAVPSSGTKTVILPAPSGATEFIALTSDLALYAPIASPTFTGAVVLPTTGLQFRQNISNGLSLVPVSISGNKQVSIPNVDGTLISNADTGTVTNTMLAGSIDLTAKVTGALPVANGGTGSTTLTANNVILGNGTSALQAVAPGTSGNVLTSNGTTWTSAAPAAGITINTTAITGGTSGRLLTSGATVGELTLGSNVSTWLGTPTLANINAAVSDADLATLGANTFTGTQRVPAGTLEMGSANYGIISDGTSYTALKANGSAVAGGSTSFASFSIISSWGIGWSPAINTTGPNPVLNRAADATLQLGPNTATNGATAVAQTFKGPNATGTTSTGGSMTIAGGTGTTAGGAVILATSATTGAPVAALTVNNNAVSTFSKPPVMPVYTVATLPATAANGMVQGAMAIVTDATAPTYLGTLTGGGAVVTPVFYNGSAWVSH